MKLRSPLLIRLCATLAAAVIWCWIGTMRFRTCSLRGEQHPLDPRQQRRFYMFWHEGLLAPITHGIEAEILISQHADGELIAQIAQRFGIGVIRGSTTRGGSRALYNMINGSDRQRHLAITPDGPRGPRRQVQLGAILVASVTGVPIVPLGIGFARAYRAKSWDRFALPYPLSGICGVFGETIHVPADLDRTALEYWRDRVQEHFAHVSELADDWAERIRREGSRAKPPASTAIVSKAA